MISSTNFIDSSISSNTSCYTSTPTPIASVVPALSVRSQLLSCDSSVSANMAQSNVSPTVTVVRRSTKRTDVMNIHTPSRKRALSSFSRGNDMAAIRECFQNQKIRPYIIRKVGQLIRKEIKALSCSNSILKSKSSADLKQFRWNAIYNDLRDKAPFFLSIMESATKTRATRKNTYRELNLVQKIISLILYASHASKEVFSRLMPLELVVSRSTVISLVDEFGKDHDALVKTWQSNITNSLALIIQSSTLQIQNYPTTRSLLIDTDDDYDEDFDEDYHFEYDLESNDNDDSDDDDDKKSDDIDDDANNGNDDNDDSFTDNDTDDDDETDGDILCDDIEAPPYSPMTRDTVEIMETDNDAQESQIISFKIVGDNIDKNINPRYRRTNNKVKSLHYYHSYAVLHRVPLGVIAKNENNIKEMSEILSHLYQYVPQVEYTSSQVVLGESVDVTLAVTHKILLGGDQLSQARARTAIKVKNNGETSASRLEGFILTVEDWHTKLTLYEVIWKYYMSPKSAAEHGTLYHIRNILGRSDTGKPKQKLNSCEDFMAIVMHSFITTATMESLGLRTVDDWPQSISESAWTESDDKLRQRMDAILNEVVDKYTNIEFNVPYTATTDRASEYIKQLLTIGSVVMEFADALREGEIMPRRLFC
uniref:DUF6589 domain-containing protein n=1 Tax=Amphimedon queenslandica TaxID=400682 RepID=A0A1X7T9Q8_AMPQE